MQADGLRARIVVAHDVHQVFGGPGVALVEQRLSRANRALLPSDAGGRVRRGRSGSGSCADRGVEDPVLLAARFQVKASPPRNRSVAVAPRAPGHGRARGTHRRSRASSELRHTSTRGTPTRSSDAVSEPIPCATPWAFMPTAGRQHTIVGEARARAAPGMSIMTATLPTSPASQCSLWASIVRSGVQRRGWNSVRRRAGVVGGASILPSSGGKQLAFGGLQQRFELSNALIAKSSSTGTRAPADMPFSVAIESREGGFGARR